MRNLKIYAFTYPAILDILLPLQLRTANEPFLPRLKTFECEDLPGEAIPFIPLFLSSRTIEISITLDEGEYHSVIATACVVTRLPTLCPELECVTLKNLPKDPVMVSAVSEMLLACNRDCLRVFFVDSPLTEEAREVVCQLPKLSKLHTVVQGHSPLPLASLPNLTAIEVEYDGHLDWLQGLRGATPKGLKEVNFHTESEQIGDFLGEFERVALTTPAPNTLVAFRFCTSRSWNPSYSSLLSFRQLERLDIVSSCSDGCDSRVDDDVVVALAQAMPKLKILGLGGTPCGEPSGTTVNGLVALASLCPHLSQLRIHFQADTLINAAITVVKTPPDGELGAVQQGDCALTELEVGSIRIKKGSSSSITSTLLKIFPHILCIHYDSDWSWRDIETAIRDSRCTSRE